MIYNKHSRIPIPPDAILVDRTTPYGNFAYRPQLATRTERIKALYRFCLYLQARPELVADIRANLRDRDLVCWCWPLDCHAEIIQGVANAPDSIAFLEQAVVKYGSQLPPIIETNHAH
jgi:hypothetical protein